MGRWAIRGSTVVRPSMEGLAPKSREGMWVETPVSPFLRTLLQDNRATPAVLAFIREDKVKKTIKPAPAEEYGEARGEE